MKKLVFLSLLSCLPLILGACGAPVAQVSASPPTPAGPTPTLRIVMQASDPSTFEIASGEPQLVKFFAYW